MEGGERNKLWQGEAEFYVLSYKHSVKLNVDALPSYVSRRSFKHKLQRRLKKHEKIMNVHCKLIKKNVLGSIPSHGLLKSICRTNSLIRTLRGLEIFLLMHFQLIVLSIYRP